MMEIIRYNANLKVDWDSFIDRSVNGLFQHKRDFINYHGERFDDHSLMVYDGNSLQGCIAGIIDTDTYVSHPGLGLSELIIKKGSTRKYRAVLLQLLRYLAKKDVCRMILKSIPDFYKVQSTVSIDFYFLASNAQIKSTKLSMVMSTASDKNYNTSAKKEIRDLAHCTLETIEANAFHKYLVTYLSKYYQTNPLHTKDEFEYLSRIFADKIICYQLLENGIPKAGACMFYYKNIAKLQYLYSEKGSYSKRLIDQIRQSIKDKYDYVDLGTSNSLADGKLNYGNVGYKESLGGLPILINTYQVDVTNTLEYLEDEQ